MIGRSVMARGTPSGLHSMYGSRLLLPPYMVLAMACTLAMYSGLYEGWFGSCFALPVGWLPPAAPPPPESKNAGPSAPFVVNCSPSRAPEIPATPPTQ